MSPTLTAFEASPDRGRGLSRDLRVRWALEEVGQPYDTRLMSFAALKAPDHIALHPFGQIPTFEDGDLALFESGAIVLHIAERHAGLLPDAPGPRGRAISWMFAALNTVEPPVWDVAMSRLLEGDKPWYEVRLPMLKDRAHQRLDALARGLEAGAWLDGGFSAGDLVMISVLMRAEVAGLLSDHPDLTAYLDRGRARPAFQRAFAAQRAVFTAAQPGP